MPEPLKKIALLFCSLSFIFFMFEVAARQADISPRPLARLNIHHYRLSANPRIRYEYQPGYSADEQPYDPDHRGFAINSAGFRDYERQIPKPENHKRIIFLGDSTTAGNGVAELSQVFTAKLEEKLNGSSTDGRIEVLNLGVGGYQTLQEVETLREKGLKYEPDLVYLVFCLNDFFMDADGGVYDRLKERASGSPQIVRGGLHLLLKHSRLAFALYHRLGLARTQHLSNREYVKRVLGGRNNVEVGFELLSQLKQNHSLKVVILILPEFLNTIDRYKRYADHEKVKQIARQVGHLPVVDLVGEFAKKSKNLADFSFDGCHLNEFGHKTLAEVLKPISERILSAS
jgi:lysophospholipase L1-like esterase